MAEALFFSWALVAGFDWRVLAVLAFALAFPVWAAVAIGVHVFRQQRHVSTDSAVFCHSAARELRSGATLRWALASAARNAGALEIADRLEAGDAIDSIVGPLSGRFDEVGSELATVVGSASIAGGSSAPLFDELGDVALMHVEITEEVRVATAPARASTALLLGFPLAYIGYLLSTSRIEGMLSDAAQRGFALAGVGLIVFGLAASYLLVGRAR